MSFFCSSLADLKEKYSVSKDAENFASISPAPVYISCAFFSAIGITGIEDAPVPPNIEPKINTLADLPALNILPTYSIKSFSCGFAVFFLR